MIGTNMINKRRASVFLMVLMTFLPMAATIETVTAKSLYVIAEKGNIFTPTVPIQAYDIGSDGTLSFQTQRDIPRSMLGALGMAVDSDAGYLFITYKNSNEIDMVNAQTMTNIGLTSIAPEDVDLTGIVYDHKKKRLYCAEDHSRKLYVYDWQSQTQTLTPVSNSPFTLKNASAYGIALDEVNDRLYVANASDTITIYSTSNWALINSIQLNRIAVSVAIDVENDYVYAGGGYAGNKYLTQYHLATGTKREVQVETDAGVMGLAVDPDTGFVYISTGRDNQPGGDNLLAFDPFLRQVDIIPAIGNPTGLAIPNRDIGYNPFHLSKTIAEGATCCVEDEGMETVAAGDTITYAIDFDNTTGSTVTDVSVVDTLPDEVVFISADDPNGQYDAKMHTYEWSRSTLPSGSSIRLELTVQIKKEVQAGTVIANTVKISSNEMAPTTKSVRVETTNNALNLTKTISGKIDDLLDGIDPDDLISYTITFDNNDNDFSVTDVSVVDYLPDEVTFLKTEEGKVPGTYDALEHTITWLYPILRSGEAVSLGLVVHVNPDTIPGTIITNSAMIQSNETPPSLASVDTITYFKALALNMSIVGGVDGKTRWVGQKEEITYRIQFQNKDNDSDVTNVTVTDQLPQHVTFVRARADDHGVIGRYDAKEHTYTWSYASLPSIDTPITLDLVVQVNKNAPSATILSNSVTIDSDQTRPMTVSADVITYYKALSLSTEVVGSVIGETEWVDTNDTYAYKICFGNDNESAVTNILIVDTLPKDVQFESADGDGDFGWYDPKVHTYTWLYPSLSSRSSSCFQIVTRVKPGTVPSTILTNLVTIDSDETMPTTSSIDVVVGESPLEVPNFRILPEIIRDTIQSYDIQATAIFPPGIGKDDIKEVLPTLYPGRISAKQQIIFGTSTTAKVIALFDKADLVNAVSETGQVTLSVVGKLKTGRSWYGQATVYISGYTGN